MTLSPGHDTIVREALLGLQFRDAVDGRVVAEGLQVEIEDLWQPRRRQALMANRSGVFALHRFAGQRGFGDDDIDSPQVANRFRVTARDTLGRYVATSVSPPVPGDGLFAPRAAGSPPGLTRHVPLFSAATRPVPVAMASLRAELRECGHDDRPVRWARLELWLGSERLAEGLADDAGRVMLVFPLPRPRAPVLRASPAAAGTYFDWSVTLRAFSQAGLPTDPIPDLEDLFAQPEVGLLQGASPPVPLAPLTLHAGETLIAASPPSSFLYVAE